MIALNFENCSLVSRSNSEDGFKDFPWILFQLLMAEGQATVGDIDFEDIVIAD